MTRHSAGRATYRGDVRSIVGEVKGPTTYGSQVVAVDAVYDEASNTTWVAFVHLTEADKANMVRDEFGFLRLSTLEEVTP